MITFTSQRVSWSRTGCLWILIASTDLCGGSITSAELSSERVKGITLSAKDRERWSRYRSAAKREQFLKSRHAISFVLKQEFGDSQQLVWDSRPDGCPVLCDLNGNVVRNVSLSHSANAFAIGLDSTCSRIGVDCEMVDDVPAEAVFRILEGDVSYRMRKTADPVLSRWEAAMRWTRYEADWKAMQNGNRFANQAQHILSSSNEKNCGSLKGPTCENPLRSPMWMVISQCSGVAGNLPNQELVRPLALTGPDLCVCVTGDTLEQSREWADSVETRSSALHNCI